MSSSQVITRISALLSHLKNQPLSPEEAQILQRVLEDLQAITQARLDQDTANLKYGTIKWFNDEKGFGFIDPDDGGPSLFVHHSAILGEGFHSLAEGSRVSYQEGRGGKGPHAQAVRKNP